MNMKKIFCICIAALAFVATGCNQEKDIDLDTFGGKGLEFVHFAAPAASWLVAAEDESYDYAFPVACTYAYEQDVTYNISLGEKTTGVEGKDFSLPAKSVTIKAGKYSADLPVKVLYETTGEGFQIELVLNVDEKLINPAYGKKALITVKSDKITIDWKWLEGDWDAQDASGGDPYTMTISKVEGDDTKAVFNNIWGSEGDMVGTVDFDARTVAFKGPIGLCPAYGGVLTVAHFDAAAGAYDTGEFYAVLSPLGITISGMGFFLIGGDYNGYDFGTDTTTLTR